MCAAISSASPLGERGRLGVVVLHAGLAGDREARRDRKSHARHLGEVRTLAAEQELHALVALGVVAAVGVLAEREDALCLRQLHGSFPRGTLEWRRASYRTAGARTRPRGGLNVHQASSE